MNKTTFWLLFALLGGIIQNRGQIDRWLNPPAPEGPGSNDVILYSTIWCGYCAKTRKYFTENNIDYVDLDIENSEEGRADYQRMGVRGIPIIVVNNKTIIHGYSPKEINAALDLDN